MSDRNVEVLEAEIKQLRAEVERERIAKAALQNLYDRAKQEREELLVRAEQAEQVIDSINSLRDKAYEELKQERNDALAKVKRLRECIAPWGSDI